MIVKAFAEERRKAKKEDAMDTSNTTNSTITFNNDSNNTGANWRDELSNDYRHKIIDEIMDAVQRHMPPTSPDGMTKFRKIVLRFEEKIFTAAVDQEDYLQKISLKMLSLRNHGSNPPVQVSSANIQRLPDPEERRKAKKEDAMDTSNTTNSTITFNNDSNNTGANWRDELSNDSRRKIVNKIMDTLQKHMPPTCPDGMIELRKIALRFEDKIFIAAVDQQDYLRKISLKMLSLRNHVSNPTVQVSSANNQSLPDPGLGIPSQMRNAPQSPVLGNLPQQQQTLLQQNLQSAMSGGGIQSTTGLTSILSSMTSLSQSTSGQDFGSQSAMTNSTGQVVSQNPLLANTQRQLQSRQQQHPQQVAQQHQQTQPQHQFFYQQQLQHLQQQALLKEKFQQQSQLASSILQQQQPPVMQQSQLQSSQQSILQSALAPTLQSTQQSLLRQFQSSALQPTQQSALQQTSQPFLQQQHQQSVLQQQQSVLQQQPFMLQEQPPSMFNVPNKEQQQHQLQQIIQSKISQYQQAQQPSPSLLQLQSQQLQQQPQQLLSQLQHQLQQLQQQQSLLPQSNTVQQDLQQGLHTSGCLLQQQQQSSVEQQKQLLQAKTQRLLNASTTLLELSGQSGQSTADLREKIYQKAGCCMPSRACGFKVVNVTQWPEVPNLSKDVQDCKLRSNKQDRLSYDCVSCRAGMLMKLREEWSNYVGNVNFVAIMVLMVVFLVALFCIG